MFDTLSIDVDLFHRVELPARLASGNAELVAKAAAGLRPITFAVAGTVWTYRPTTEGLDLVEGELDGAWRVEFDNARFAAYVDELHTGFGILYGGFATGSVEALPRWEPAIRAAFQGRPVYDPGTIDLGDVDLDRTFILDDPVTELAAHIDRVGFALVKRVFDHDELEALRAEADRLMGLAKPGDDRSWWAANADGDDVLCRLTYVSERSQLFADLHLDPRLDNLIPRLGHHVVAQPERHDGHSVVIKNAEIVSGLSDLPWHIDCGLGGHPVMCPAFNVGVQLDAATADSGQLHFLVGSPGTTAFHLSPDQLATDEYPTVALTTEAGDLTIHATDVLHAAPPPTGAGGRRVFYTTFKNPKAIEVIPEGQGYNDVVLRSGEGNRVRNLAES